MSSAFDRVSFNKLPPALEHQDIRILTCSTMGLMVPSSWACGRILLYSGPEQVQ